MDNSWKFNAKTTCRAIEVSRKIRHFESNIVSCGAFENVRAESKIVLSFRFQIGYFRAFFLVLVNCFELVWCFLTCRQMSRRLQNGID